MIKSVVKGTRSMRLVFKALVVVFLAVGIGNYLIYLKTGQLPANDWRERFGNWVAEFKGPYSADQLTNKARQTVDDLTGSESDKPASTKVYKWTDDNGQVHYGDKPVSASAEQIDINIQNAISTDEAEPEPVSQDSGTQQSPLEKARAAAEAMKARTQQQEAN